MEPRTLLDAEAIATFQRDGVVHVRGVLDAEQVETAREAIAAVLADPSELSQVASADDDPGRFAEDFCRWQQISAIERLARDSAVPSLAAALLQSEVVRLYHDHVLVKEGGTTQRLPGTRTSRTTTSTATASVRGSPSTTCPRVAPWRWWPGPTAGRG